MMIKAYSYDACYEEINTLLRKNGIEEIQTYLTACIEGLSKFYTQCGYQTFHLPVYRGIDPSNVNIDDYPINSILTWPQFTSTSKNDELAIGWSRMNSSNDNGPALVMKIYLSSQNKP